MTDPGSAPLSVGFPEFEGGAICRLGSGTGGTPVGIGRVVISGVGRLVATYLYAVSLVPAAKDMTHFAPLAIVNAVTAKTCFLKDVVFMFSPIKYMA